MCDILDIPCYLVTMDIEKALDSLYQYFLLFAFKSFVKETTIMSYKWGFFNSIFQLGWSHFGIPAYTCFRSSLWINQK